MTVVSVNSIKLDLGVTLIVLAGFTPHINYGVFYSLEVVLRFLSAGLLSQKTVELKIEIFQL